MKNACALVIAALGITAVPLMAGPATAASDKQTIPLVCDNGHSYSVEVNGNGDFTPARDLASTAVFVPDAFGPFTGEIRDAQGQLVDSFTDPATVKGSGKQKTNITCTYTFSQVSDGSDPSFPAGYTFSGSGTVTGKITG
jgi:hypothetical protein